MTSSADEPGYDPLMQAAGGIMECGPEIRVNRRCARVSPLSTKEPGCGRQSGILAALLDRQKGQRGARLITTSLFEAAVNLASVPHRWLPRFWRGVPGPNGSGVAMIAPYEAF